MIELIDTSALILARRHESVRSLLAGSIDRDEVAVCDVVELEYLMGARDATDYARLEDALRGFRRFTTEADDWAQARRVHRALAARGAGHQRSVRIPDLLVAAVAERAGVAVLHYDEDYDRIAAVTAQATRWVVPRGSI